MTGATTGSPGATAGAPALGALRTTPKGFKRPYSEATIGEMKAGEKLASAAGSAAGAASVPADTAKPGETDKTDAAKAEAAKAEAAKAAAAKTEAAKLASLPALSWPVRGKISQTFAAPKHMGIIVEGKSGDLVTAAADGRVIFSGPGPRGYGNLIIVKHESDMVTVYGHNKTLLIKETQSVKRGQKIAEVGDSGADRTGLYFEVRVGGNPIDPQKLLPKR